MNNLARMVKVRSKGKLHPDDWRNFRVKKHWYGIHFYGKKIRKECCESRQDYIRRDLFNGAPKIRNRFLMRCKARYQSWGWYSNN